MYYSSENPQLPSDLEGQEPVSQEPVSQEAVRPAPARVQPPPRKKRVWLRMLALILVCGLIGGGAGVGGALLTQRLLQSAAAPTGGTVIYEGTGAPVKVELSKSPSGKEMTFAQVYASNVDCVVGIITQKTTNVWGQQVASAAAGSGFVLTQDGYIVTNNHVVEGADSITVQFKNGDKLDAKLVGSEADFDVAVLKVDAAGLTPVRLGSSDDIVVGQEVLAIGNPLGEMTFSATHGIVSALDKPFVMPDDEDIVVNVIQIDAAINLGNSGGPLFNTYGQVIGITNGKYSNNGSTKAAIEGICFAIPIDDVKDILTDLIEHGYVTGKPFVGATLATVNAQAAAQYGRPGGAYVQSLVPGGPAEKAGLKKGDIITAMDGEEVDGHASFIALRDKHKAGETVELTVDREARTITLSLTFGERTPEAQTAPDPEDSIIQNNTPGDTYQYNYGFGFNPFSWFGW